MHPSEPPGHAADHPGPARPTLPTPHGGAGSASALLAAPAARCSSSSRLEPEAASPVAGVTSEVVRLRSAVEE
eukprot:2784490-Prymnesium_polylepis.1